MKLPLRYGLLALLGVFLAHSAVDDQRLRLLLLVVGMGLALWTAFSLKIPPRREPENRGGLEVLHEGADEMPRIGALGQVDGPRIVPDDPNGPADQVEPVEWEEGEGELADETGKPTEPRED